MEAGLIELFDDKAKCHNCGYEFTAQLILERKDQETCEVRCPKCHEKYFTMIRPELLAEKEKEMLKEQEEEINIEEAEREMDEIITDYYEENDPQFCGKCKRTVDRYIVCPKCHISPKEFSLRDKKVPGYMKFFEYTFLFLGILAIFSLFLGIIVGQVVDLTMIIWAFFSLGSYFSFKYGSKIMSTLGLITCNNCEAPISPKSVFCIYCGHRVPYAMTRGNKIGMVIALSLVFLLIAGLVILVPPELKIDNITYVRPSINDTECEVTVTLTNELRKIAEKEDIMILFNVGGQIYKYEWEGNDVEYQKKEPCTFIIPLPEYRGNYVSMVVHVYRIGHNRITGESVENWQDSEFVPIYYR